MDEMGCLISKCEKHGKGGHQAQSGSLTPHPAVRSVKVATGEDFQADGGATEPYTGP